MTKAEIYYKDIGDYLSREEKLKIVREGKSILNPDLKMSKLNPNEHGDWLNKRNSIFDDFIPIESEKKFDSKTRSFFTTYAAGIVTSRDSWVYNFSKTQLKNNMKNMIHFYEKQRNSKNKPNNYLDSSPNEISWSVNLKKDFEKNKPHKFNENVLCLSLYRPFSKMNLFYDHNFIERPGIWSQLFYEIDNKMICISGTGVNKDFSVIITDSYPDFQLQANTQCFPFYWYEKKQKTQDSLFEKAENEYTRHDAISDFILEQAQSRYGNRVAKEDIFYYVYGILHSPDYRITFANDLKKMLPRLPLVEKPADFWSFSKAGRNLAEIHLNYEDQEPPKEVLINGKIGNGEWGMGNRGRGLSELPSSIDSSESFDGNTHSSLPTNPFPIPHSLFPSLTVNKMCFPSKEQKDTIIYNSNITISNIPLKAYEYIVNGKSAIEWVMERYQKTCHKESGITNDPNDWASEHNDPQYILNLLLSVITVSLKTVDIVAGLPKVEWG